MATKTNNDPNYLYQINAFHRFTETYYLPVNAKMVWFMLLDLCNKCGWQEWFQVDAERIMHWIGAKNVKTAYHARDLLKAAGLLEYEKGHKGCPTRYKLCFFDVCEAKPRTQSRTQSRTETVGNDGYITKQNETKQNKTHSLLSAGADDGARERVRYQDVVDAFNRVCVSLPKVLTLNDARKRAVAAAAKTVESAGGWERLFAAVEDSDFLTGRTGAWNGCSFDWILKSANLVKIIEGNYADKPVRKEASGYDGANVGTTL